MSDERLKELTRKSLACCQRGLMSFTELPDYLKDVSPNIQKFWISQARLQRAFLWMLKDFAI